MHARAKAIVHDLARYFIHGTGGYPILHAKYHATSTVAGSYYQVPRRMPMQVHSRMAHTKYGGTHVHARYLVPSPSAIQELWRVSPKNCDLGLVWRLSTIYRETHGGNGFENTNGTNTN